MSLPDVSEILLERQNDVLTIWFNRPEHRNALSQKVADELLAVFKALPAEKSIRIVVLRGKGGVFCAGGDLKQLKEIFQGEASRDDVVRINAGFGHLITAIEALPQLLIVAIEGAAMAGGLGLACLADVTFSTVDARFALSEVTLGIPPAQIAPLVMRRIGETQARRLLLTAAQFDGAQAKDLGFAHEVFATVDAMDTALHALIAQARRGAPGAIAATKRIIDASKNRTGDDLVQYAAAEFADCLLGEEAREGLAAFAQKRAPKWVSEG
ncbi:MAG: enoyl-CoA hydratase [Gammaproteobacteria bacterium]|nr:MAG: enoyl-CoA hydratase [Gammaproteobacteria bacterium]